MVRRVFAALVPVVVLPLAASCAGSPTPRAGERPNVLLIAIDDLGDWVGALGAHPQVRTPHIDRLAARGMLFTNAHCAAPACNPSRAAIWTGVAPHRSGIYHNTDRLRRAWPDAVTLPQHFRAHGYRTLAAGKIFHGHDAPSWDAFRAGRQGGEPADPVPDGAPRNGFPADTGAFDWGPVDAEPSAFMDGRAVAWAVEQLAREHGRPFLLACGIFRPHLPWYVPHRYFERFPLESIALPAVLDDDLDDVPAIALEVPRLGMPSRDPRLDHERMLEHDQWRHAVQGYLASIAFADDLVGELLDALDQSGHADDTVVVLWGDHGWHLGEKRQWRKFTLWEAATRTPLVVVAPGVTQPGSRSARPVTALDVFPTLCDLCGVPSLRGLDGVTLRPLLQHGRHPWGRPVLTTHGPKNHAVRSERFRLIRYADGSVELYDHATDPHEWHNLADSAAFAAVRAQLEAWLP